jgi:hypothetical protein
VKERPILFSGAMARALLDGRKTQTRRVMSERHRYHFIEASGDLELCPYGVAGDRLWVRESFWGCDMPGYGDHPCVVYEDEWHGKEYHAAEVRPYARRFGHIPGIHMPRDCSRITLEVTNVRVERLRDISVRDAIAEGAEPLLPHLACTQACPEDYVAGYRKLWDSLNAARGYGWDVNPWVWVVEFKKVGA